MSSFDMDYEAAGKVKNLCASWLFICSFLLSCFGLKGRIFLLWAQSLLHIILLFRFNDGSKFAKAWISRLRQYVSPSSYSFKSYCKKFAVYLKIPCSYKSAHRFHFPHRMSYVGATQAGLASREANRIAKLRQLLNRKLIKAEPALLWWSEKSNYTQFSTICIANPPDKAKTFTMEHVLISKWQPMLNFPFICHHFKMNSSGFQQAKPQTSLPYQLLGHRLFRKVRKRITKHSNFRHAQFRSKPMPQNRAWEILFDLCSATKRSFDAERHIRSLAVSPDEVYALFRLAHNLEQPHRSAAISCIKRCLIFRQLSIPKSNLPLTIPFLCIPDFSKQVKGFLRLIVQGNIDHALPFHLPTMNTRESKFPSLESCLFNFKTWLEFFSSPQFHPQQLQCCCQQWHIAHPNLTMTNGHIASSCSRLSCSSRIKEILSANSKSSYYTSPIFYINQTTLAFKKWLKHHGLPQVLAPKWAQFVRSLWPLHAQNAAFKFHSKHVFQAKELLHRHWVIHNADHQASHFMMYCPVLYFNTTYNTWNDETVFHQVPLTLTQAHAYVLEQIPTVLTKFYPWAINPELNLAYGYVFLKKKKDFTTARTIISYATSIFGKLLKAAAIILYDILAVTWPETMGLDSSPVIWKKLHQFLEDTADIPDLVILNDDLVGFFNSIPQSTICEAVQALINDYLSKHPSSIPFHQITLSVNLNSLSSKFRVFRGKIAPLSKLNTKPIWLCHLLTIIQMSFNAGIFTALGCCWRQARGTSIGNQISPVLSSIAVSFIEKIWQQIYRDWWKQEQMNWFHTRYVDNRFCLVPLYITDQAPFRTFASADFYIKPVEIEPVGDNKILGFIVDPKSRTITYDMPSEQWQFRSPKSAGSLRLNLSGFRSRRVLISRQTFPKQNVSHMLQSLTNIYLQQGFTLAELKSCF